MNYYSIHGLLVCSEITLGALPKLEQKCFINRSADVQIKKTVIDYSDSFDHSESRDRVTTKKLSPQDIWLNLPNIAKFHIKDGNLIEIDPYEGTPKQSVLLYLFGSIFATLLYQRKKLVLHANAIEINDKAILFAGDSGAGKSTTAAIFNKKGFNVLSDDIISLDKELKINGGFPQIKLFQDSLNELNYSNKNLTPIFEQKNKYIYPIENQISNKPLDIVAIYTLTTASESNPDQFTFSPINGMQRFNKLIKNTYRNELIEGLEMQNHHLDMCATLSKTCLMVNIIRPISHFNGYELVDTIIDHLKKNTNLAL